MGGRRSGRPPVVALSRLCWPESVDGSDVCRSAEPASGGAGVRPRPSYRSPARPRPPTGTHRRCRVVGVPREQAHVPAEHPPPGQDPRLPAADADPRGPGDPRRSSAQGSREPLRLTCCPRRHACAGVRSSPRSSGPADAPGDRPWCSTTSPNGPRRRPGAPRRTGCPARCLRPVHGPVSWSARPWATPWSATASPASCAPPSVRSSTGCPRRPIWSSGPGPRRRRPGPRSCGVTSSAGMNRLLGDGSRSS